MKVLSMQNILQEVMQEYQLKEHREQQLVREILSDVAQMSDAKAQLAMEGAQFVKLLSVLTSTPMQPMLEKKV